MLIFQKQASQSTVSGESGMSGGNAPRVVEVELNWEQEPSHKNLNMGDLNAQEHPPNNKLAIHFLALVTIWFR